MAKLEVSGKIIKIKDHEKEIYVNSDYIISFEF